MDKNSKPEQIEIISKQIEDALEEIGKIKNRTSELRNPNDLEQFEKRIAKATDRLAGLLTAKAIQESLDSDAVKEQSGELVRNMPGAMESQGLREVNIMPARGGAVTVKTAYYTKKKAKKRKKKKKR